jgi:cell wall-associated NlpC family hydrolase/regulator of replication initiation timing
MTPALAAPDDLASKQAEVDRIKAEISSINLAAEQAVERYNQANVELESTRQRLAENEKALTEATAKLKEAQDRLSKRLENIYREGNLSFWEVVLDTSNFSDFISRFDLLGKIGDQDKSDIDTLLNYKAEVESAKTELDQTRQKQEELLKTLALEKSQVESQLAARQAVLSSAQGEIAQLVAQQEQQQWQSVSGGAAPAVNQPGPAADPGAPLPPSDESLPALPPPTAGAAVSIAMQYLGVPYVWGGASPSGFDCSGLVMYVYAQIGIYLPHSAAAQYNSGTPISYSELAPGDLVFFGRPISHVGIYIGGGRMIHAPFEGAVVSISSVGAGGSYAGACRL